MNARYQGLIVRVIAYATKGDRSQIATARGLRWVKTSDLERPAASPNRAITPAAAATATSGEAGPQ